MSDWADLIKRIKSIKNSVKIGLVGKYVELHDAYISVAQSLRFAGYQELVNAIGDAINMAVEKDGAQVTDHTEIAQVKDRSFSEVMTEAKEIWTTYLNSAPSEEEKDQRLNIMMDIIKKVFGTEGFKLSQAVPSQVDLIELFITEVKELM